MDRSIFSPFSQPSTRSLELKALAAAQRGEPIPMDVAAHLMDAGYDVPTFENNLRRDN